MVVKTDLELRMWAVDRELALYKSFNDSISGTNAPYFPTPENIGILAEAIFKYVKGESK